MSSPAGAPHFWHYETGLKVWWYKYIGRGVETKGDLREVPYVLQSCLRSLGMLDELPRLAKQLYGEDVLKGGSDE